MTGEAWNHIETQWAAIQSDADIHSHDSRYYPKATADSTFFSLTFYTGFDCDLLDGQHFSDLLATVMPLGAIMIWSGTDANVPSGWHICDGGTYGGKVSPDLRDRFVIGAGGDYAVGATGGPATWNGNCSISGTVTIGDHALTTDEIPSHNHEYTEYYNVYNVGTYLGTMYGNPVYRNTAVGNQDTGGGAHGHPGSTISGTFDPRPLYHSLYYIMKYA
ncbi:phage tail protein [Candidatus Pacearchaeota archaeon]|nr:phage tail protein [Candidatus Pacearchaeota archaeon]